MICAISFIFRLSFIRFDGNPCKNPLNILVKSKKHCQLKKHEEFLQVILVKIVFNGLFKKHRLLGI